MAKKRSLDQQLADLKERQRKERLHTSARARLDSIKTMMHGRCYADAHESALELALELEALNAPQLARAEDDGSDEPQIELSVDEGAS